jgi:beta-phosphoglucomutase
MVKGIIFDLDGVIVNTERNHFFAWKRIAERLDIDFDESDNELLKGLNRRDSLEKLLALKGGTLEENLFDDVLDKKNRFYLNSLDKLSRSDILPGVVDVLNSARENGVSLSVGSSSKNAKFILDKLRLSEYFEIVIDGNGVTSPKPHPEVFLNAAKGMSLDPAECVVLEDAASGVEAAKAGGFKVIGVGNPNIASLADDYLSDLTTFKF